MFEKNGRELRTWKGKRSGGVAEAPPGPRARLLIGWCHEAWHIIALGPDSSGRQLRAEYFRASAT